jgi:hypothetical protein
MSDTEEIRKRHEKKEEELKKIRAVPRSQKQAEALHHNYLFGSPSHQDRGVLLNRIAELEQFVAKQGYCPKCLQGLAFSDFGKCPDCGVVFDEQFLLLWQGDE